MEIKRLFTSESVSEGHPDKICDSIADAILDYCLSKDRNSRTAVEVLATRNRLIIAGEVTSLANPDYEKIARTVCKEIGYDDISKGLDYKTMEVEVYVDKQSENIAAAVNSSQDTKDIGAGDQGIMFGYATDETENYMPLPIVVAHKLVRKASILRKNGTLPFLCPDMKSQVTIDYTSSTPRLNAVVMSLQHIESVDMDYLKNEVMEKVIAPVISDFHLDIKDCHEFYINPSGKFVIGGPAADTGVTGRKIIVDTYGGMAPHGGGAFSGKDPTKVDRSAAYAARHAAKNIVASSLAKRCLIQLSYAIGVSKPISISVETYGTERVSKEKILSLLLDETLFNFAPSYIIEKFSLNHPPFRYQDLANYGHFGRPDLDLPFEYLDKVEEIKKRL